MVSRSLTISFFLTTILGVDATSNDDVTSGYTSNVTLSPEKDSLRARSTSTLSRVKDQVSNIDISISMV